MKFLFRALALLFTFLLVGFELAPEVSLITKELVTLNKKVADIESEKAKLEKNLFELAKRIEELKAKGQGPIARAQLERLLKNASVLSDQLESLELKLQQTKQKKAESSLKLARLCNKKMELYADSVKSATTKEEAKKALEAYLAYHHVRDVWVAQEASDTKEFLIPRADPNDSVAELKRKLVAIDDINRILEQLKGESQRQLDALTREQELEKEILQKSELKRMFEEGEIETFGSVPSAAELKRIETEIKKVEGWRAYLERVKSELAITRGEIIARIKELVRDVK